MELNKQDKENFKTALFFLKGGYKDKPEISESTGQRVEIKFDTAFAGNDEDLLKGLADEIFAYLERYPELKEALKKKYF